MSSSSGRESWMIGSLESLPFSSHVSGKVKREAEAAEARNKLALEMRKRELNQDTSRLDEARKTQTVVNVTDGGASWLHRALNRAKEQAAREGRSLEEVAAERWGSLEKLESMIAQSQKPGSEKDSGHRDRHFDSVRRHSDRDNKVSASRRGWRKSDSDRVSPESVTKHSNESNRSSHRTNYDRGLARCSGDRSDKLNVDVHVKSDRKSYDDLSRRKLDKDSDSYCRPVSSQHRGSNNEYEVDHSHRTRPIGDISKNEFEEPDGRDVSSADHSCRSSLVDVCPRAEVVTPKNLPRNIVTKLKGWSGKEFMRSSEAVVGDHVRQDCNISNTGKAGRSESGGLAMEPSPPASPIHDLGQDSVGEFEAVASGAVISKDELNRLSAKMLKAELAGKSKLVEKIRTKIAAAQNASKPSQLKTDSRSAEREQNSGGSTQKSNNSIENLDQSDNNNDELSSVLLRINPRSGLTVPYVEKRRAERRDEDESGDGVVDKKAKRKLRQGDAILARDQSLADMIEEEKMTSANDQHSLFASLARDHSAGSAKTSEDFVIDDTLMEKKVRKMEKVAALDRSRAIKEQRAMEAVLDHCIFCLGARNFKKHLVVAKGPSTYVSVPVGRSMVAHQCCIAPLGHFASSLHLEENVAAEIREWQASLTKMFRSQGLDAIFIEIAARLHRSPHARIQCFPVPADVGEMAPAYFKKEILDCEGEWLQNKRLVKFGGSGQSTFQKSIPKGFPYFAVWFGRDFGFAHVIEREDSFPLRFGEEIIAGMLEIDFVGSQRDRGDEKDFAGQLKRVSELKTLLKPYDWNIEKG